ncbi:PGF-pre-PGF domain-containing protein [Nanoarchaeota archaeon]
MRHTNMMKTVLLFLFVLVSAQSVYALGLGTFEDGLSYTADQTASIKYYVTKGLNDSFFVNFDFNGTLAPYATFRIDHYWYSTKVDTLDVYLEREFDLTGVSSATLKFYTKYNIEYGWDFGYVEVSTDNRSTWTQLSGTSTTTFRDGSAYVGVPGAHAYTGTVSSWSLETMDLTPFTGNNTLLRFRYVTDDAYAERGWFVDDISIEELGFSDDVESGSNGWSTDSWLHNVLLLDDTSKTVPVYIDFVIPDNYTYADTEEKIIVANIPGVEGDINPGQNSVSYVIATLPPVTKITTPAPTPTSGGGGGGGGTSSYTTQGDDVVKHVILHASAGTIQSFSVKDPDNPVKQVSIALNSFVKDAAVQITALDSRPASIKHIPPKVYRYFEASTVNIYNKVIDKATLRVAVPKSWVEGQKVGPEDIVVSRFSGGSWEDLDTALVEQDTNNYYFDTSSPGFSTFAIRVRGPIGPPKTIKPIPTVKPDILSVKGMTIVTGNESAEDVMESIREELLQKTKTTEEWVDPIMPEAEKPADTGLIWSKAIPIILILFVFVIILIMSAVKAFGKRPPVKDMPAVAPKPKKIDTGPSDTDKKIDEIDRKLEELKENIR